MVDFAQFGSDYAISFPKMMQYIAVLLRGLTINIHRRNVKPIPWILYIINITSAVCYFYVYVFSMFWFMLIRCPHTKDDKTICFLEFSLSVCSVSPMMKLVFMKLYANTIINLVEAYLQCDSLVVQNSRFAENITRILKIVKKRAVILWAAFIVNGIVYIVLPYMLPGRHLSEDLYVIYGLEPLLESPNYEIASALMISAVAYAVIALANVTIFIIIIIGYIEAQMLALSEELLNLWTDSERFFDRFVGKNSVFGHIDKGVIRNMFIKNRLQEIHKFHIINIQLSDIFDKGFRIIYLIKFMFIFSAIVAELLSGLENSNIVIPYTFNQVFLDCFIGQRLIDASRLFEEAVFNCKWESFDVANQKSVLLILRNSQKTLKLSAGGIAVLNYPFLMYIIRSSYSVYTTLQSTVK